MGINMSNISTYNVCFDGITISSGKTGDFGNKPKQKTVKDELQQIIYNPPATVVMWNDGTKTVVKATENDKYNPVFAVLMAYFQKHSGLTKTQVGKFCDKILVEHEAQQIKKNKIKDVKVTDKNFKYETGIEFVVQSVDIKNEVDCDKNIWKFNGDEHVGEVQVGDKVKVFITEHPSMPYRLDYENRIESDFLTEKDLEILMGVTS